MPACFENCTEGVDFNNKHIPAARFVTRAQPHPRQQEHMGTAGSKQTLKFPKTQSHDANHVAPSLAAEESTKGPCKGHQATPTPRATPIKHAGQRSKRDRQRCRQQAPANRNTPHATSISSTPSSIHHLPPTGTGTSMMLACNQAASSAESPSFTVIGK